MFLASPEHEAFSVFRTSFSVSFEPISVLIASSDPLDRRICFCVTAAPSNKFCVPNRKTVRRRITHRDTVCRARMLETLTWCVALLWRQHLHARGMFVFFYDTLSLSHSLSLWYRTNLPIQQLSSTTTTSACVDVYIKSTHWLRLRAQLTK